MKKVFLLSAVTFLAACTPVSTGVIILQSPTPNAVVTSPLVVKGEAPGTWFFEANLPIKLLDDQGAELAIVGAQATEDWMTTDMVSFEGTLTFTTNRPKGTLVIMNDNPSGEPANAKQESFSVKFQ